MDEMKRNFSIDSNGLNDAIIKIEKANKNIEEIFARVQNTMKSMYNNEIWSGNTNEAMYNRFIEFEKFFPKMNVSLANFTKFLRITNENYLNAENTINNDIDKNIENLNVN